jgi:glycine/D-amino acid oxidase-like deaminating enzyme
LLALGHENLEAIEKTVRDHRIDCDFLRSGEIAVAVEPYQVEELRSTYVDATRFGEGVVFLERDQVRAMVNSPTYLGGLHDRDGVAMVNPARLAWGLRKACLDLGARLYEGTPVTALEASAKAIHVKTPHGSV